MALLDVWEIDAVDLANLLQFGRLVQRTFKSFCSQTAFIIRTILGHDVGVKVNPRSVVGFRWASTLDQWC
jgi:hypothetical protein